MSELKVVLYTFLFWLIVFPLLSPFLLVSLLLKCVVKTLVQHLFPNCVPIFGLDLICVGLSPEKDEYGVILTLFLKLEGNLDINKFRRHFKETFLQEGNLQPVFLQYIMDYCGYSFRNQVPIKDLQLVRHIREEFIEGSFDDISNKILAEDSLFQKKKGEVFRPSWEIVLVNRGQDGSLLMFKVDHALLDGYSFAAIIHKLTERWEDFVIGSGQHKEIKMSLMNKVKLTIFGPALFYLHILNMTRNLPINPEQSLDPNTVISTTTMDIQLIKTIRKRTGCRVLPILLASQAQAFSDLAKELRYTRLPSSYCPIFSIPVANHPSISGHLCNHWTGGQLRVSLDHDLPLLEKLRQTQARFESNFDQRLDLVVLQINKILSILPIALNRKIFQAQYIGSQLNLMTSMILSPKPYFLLGHKITGTFNSLMFNPKIRIGGGGWCTSTRGNVIDVSYKGQNQEFIKTQKDADRLTKILFPSAIQRLLQETENT